MNEHKRSAILNSTRNCLLTGLLSLLLFSGCAEQTDLKGHSTSDRLIALGDGVCRDTRTGKMWQMDTSRTIRSLEDAQKYAGTMERGGYNDWRLPTVSELYDLYIIFDLHKNGDCEMKVEGNYWSDEPDMDGRVGTWELDDNCDPERQYIPKKKGLVRAVRP
ncbi:Lcl domain-containing protein [Desulfomarina sp.]